MVDPVLTLLMVSFPIKNRKKKECFPLGGLHVVNTQSPLLMVSIPFLDAPAAFPGKRRCGSGLFHRIGLRTAAGSAHEKQPAQIYEFVLKSKTGADFQHCKFEKKKKKKTLFRVLNIPFRGPDTYGTCWVRVRVGVKVRV